VDPITGLPSQSTGGNALQGGPQAAGGVNFTLFGNPSGAQTSGSVDWKIIALVVIIAIVVLLLKVL
jgi:hypothetical protein